MKDFDFGYFGTGDAGYVLDKAVVCKVKAGGEQAVETPIKPVIGLPYGDEEDTIEF